MSKNLLLTVREYGGGGGCMDKVAFEPGFHGQREKAKTTVGAEVNMNPLWGVEITLARTNMVFEDWLAC